jgi:uncharacterized protein YutE (UPF0331/DUF86 family)
MTTDEAAKYLCDADTAAERIARFTAGRIRRLPGGRHVARRRRAAVRDYREAFAGLRRVDPMLAQSIPDMPRVIAFRNVLIHAYATVDDRLVWDVVEQELPTLRSAIAKLRVLDSER